MAHSYKAASIFGPDVELLDCPLFGRGRVRRVNEANKGRWRSPKATDLPSCDMPAPAALAHTLSHGPNIGRPGRKTESALVGHATAVFSGLFQALNKFVGINLAFPKGNQCIAISFNELLRLLDNVRRHIRTNRTVVVDCH